jgi:hypothetical protein
MERVAFWMWYGPSLWLPRGICLTRIPSERAAVLKSLAESEDGTASFLTTGARIDSSKAALTGPGRPLGRPTHWRMCASDARLLTTLLSRPTMSMRR